MRLSKTIISIIFLLLPLSMTAQGTKYTISGFVRDSSSGETLIGAAIIDELSSQGTVTNSYGYYSLSIPGGKHTLRISCMGYSEMTVTVELNSDLTRNFSLEFAPENLKGAVVTAQHSEIGVRGSQMSAIEVPVNQIRAVPALGGEVDLVKALQLLPGVQSGTEGAAGMYVRGGGPDENLLLLDGVPVYNINHLMGFFSVFNADAVKNVTMYKGSFPARFGSRLSSVVDIRTKDGNEQQIKGSASVGLISAKFNLNGPIVKGKTTFNVSARRTYYDLLLAPILMKVSTDSENVGAGYYFYDLNAKITHRFSDSDKVYASFYYGDDAVNVKYKDKYKSSEYNSVDKMKFDWKWGNMVASARWNHVFSPNLFMNAGVNYTRYRHTLGLNSNNETSYADKTKEMSDVLLSYDSGISDVSAQVDFEYRPVNGHEIRFGSDLTLHEFNPSVSTRSYKVEMEDVKMAQDTTFGDKLIRSRELALFAEDNWSVCDWLKMNLGARYSLYNVSGKTYHSLEPRLSMRALLTPDFSIKASYTQMSQYVHLLSNSNLSLPTDLWVPVTTRIKPMKSNQYAAGLFYSVSMFDFSVEGYYKDMLNILEYRDGASFLGTASGWEDKVAMGRGWAYGVEFFAQKKVGDFTGWIGYTWSRSFRQFDREGNVINNGIVFPAKYDRIHDLSATFSYKFNDRIDVSATFVYGTGTTGSLPMESIIAPSYEGDLSYSLDYLSGRNNYRLPAYHRADVGVNFVKPKRHGKRIFNVSVYNVYNHLNPFLVYPGTEYTYSPETGVSTGKTVLKQVSIFPIIPSISYTYEF